MTPVSASSTSPSFTPSPLPKKVRFEERVESYFFDSKSPSYTCKDFSRTVLNNLPNPGIPKRENQALTELIRLCAQESISNMIINKEGEPELFSHEKHSFNLVFNNFKTILYLLQSIGQSCKKGEAPCTTLFDPKAPSDSQEDRLFILSPIEHSVQKYINKAIDLDRVLEEFLEKLPEERERKQMTTRCFWGSLEEFSPIDYSCLRWRAKWEKKEISDMPLSCTYSVGLINAYLLNPKKNYQRPASLKTLINEITFKQENLLSLKSPDRTFVRALDFSQVFLSKRDESISEEEHKTAVISMFNQLPRIFQQSILLSSGLSLEKSVTLFYKDPFRFTPSIILFRDRVLTLNKKALCYLTSMLDYCTWINRQLERTDRAQITLQNFNSIYFYERDGSISEEEHTSLIIDMFDLLPKFIKLTLLEKIVLKHGIEGCNGLDEFHKNPIKYVCEVKETITFFTLPV